MGLTRPRAHQLQDSDFKQSVRAIQTSNITLSGGAPSTVDGVSVSLGDRILVTGQSTASQNGIYVVTTVGSGSNGTWARSADADTTGDMTAGMVVMVTEGTNNADTSWKITTDDPITLDTTNITFEQSSAYGYGTISVAGQDNIVADQVGDTLTVAAGNNIVLTTTAGSDTLTVAGNDTPTFQGITVEGVYNVSGNIIPTANITYNLGNATNRFNDLFLAGNTIDLGGTKVSVTGDGDVEFKDSSNNPKRIIASEIELGTGANKVKLKRGTNGKFEFTDQNDTKTAADLTQNDTDDLSEGSTNLYYTDARVASHLGSFGSNNINTTGNVVSENLTIGGLSTLSGNVEIRGQNQLRFYDSDSSNYVSFRAPTTISSNITWTLPSSDGTADQVLATNGAGTLSWADAGSGGGGSGSSYPNSTFQTLPGTDGDFDLSYNVAQTSQETPFESGGTDAFGVNLGSVFSLMDPIGSIETADETGLDLGTLT